MIIKITMKKYLSCRKLIVLTLCLIITFCGCSYNSKKDTSAINNGLTFSTESYPDDVKELKYIRDKMIRTNLVEYVKNKTEREETFKNTLSSESYSLVGWVNYKYPNLSEKEKLIKQIHLLEYIRRVNIDITPEGQFFMLVDEYSQYDDFVKYKKRIDLRDYKSKDVAIEREKFIKDNKEEFTKFISGK